MTPTEALEKVLPAYERYYNVARSAPAPFAATAEFHSHGEKYLLIRQAKIWDMDSHEYVYFAARDAGAVRQPPQFGRYAGFAPAGTGRRRAHGDQAHAPESRLSARAPGLEQSANRCNRAFRWSDYHKPPWQGPEEAPEQYISEYKVGE